MHLRADPSRTETYAGDYLAPVNADVQQIDAEFIPEEDPYVNPIGVKGAFNARDTMSGAPVTPILDESVPDSLKSFIGANTMLLAAMGAMTGLATFVGRGAGPDWSATLLQFVLTGLAFLLWLELLTQWSPMLLLHRAPAPPGTPWRMVWFAYGMQVAMVGLIANTVWRQPDVLVPMIGLGAGVLLWRALPAPVRSRPAAVVGVIVAAVLISAAILWAVDPAAQTFLQRLWQDARGR